jgi:hypothetical protein
MEAGYAFTDYAPRCTANARLMDLVNKAGMLQSSYESRMYLQRNAEYVMELERKRAAETISPCVPCSRPLTDPGTMEAERYVVRCDAVTCQRVETNPYGIGDGRKYS